MAKKQVVKKSPVKKLQNKKDNLQAFVKDVIKFCKSETAISLTTLCTNYGISKSYSAILVRVKLISISKKKGKLTVYKNISLVDTAHQILQLRDLLKKYNGSKTFEKAKAVLTDIINNTAESKFDEKIKTSDKKEKIPFTVVEKSEAEITEDVNQLKEASKELSKIDLTERLPEGYFSGMFKMLKERQLDELIINVAYESLHDDTLDAAEKLIQIYNCSVAQENQCKIVEKKAIYDFDIERSKLQTKIDQLTSNKHVLENEITIVKSELELKNNHSILAGIRTTAQIKQLETELLKEKEKSNKKHHFFKRLGYVFSNKLN
jgi:hypothetical protein